MRKAYLAAVWEQMGHLYGSALEWVRRWRTYLFLCWVLNKEASYTWSILLECWFLSWLELFLYKSLFPHSLSHLLTESPNMTNWITLSSGESRNNEPLIFILVLLIYISDFNFVIPCYAAQKQNRYCESSKICLFIPVATLVMGTIVLENSLVPFLALFLLRICSWKYALINS